MSLLYLLLILAATNIVSAKNSLRDPGICGKPTCPAFQKFNYMLGMKYTYKHNVSIESLFDGAGPESSVLHINSVFDLQFRTPCEGVLQISEAEIIFEDEGQSKATMSNRTFQSYLSEHNLRFQFENGRVSQICPSSEEPIWVLNFKKGILSSLQNAMDRFDVDQHVLERDINGDCKTSYYFKEVNGTTLVIDKKKNLASCNNRHQFYSIIPTSPYIFQKKYHKWTPMNSLLTCSQHVDHNIYTRIDCTEEHIYQPFYKQVNGAKTKAKQTIELIEEEESSDHDLHYFIAIEKRDDLLFDHRKTLKATHDDLFECETLLYSLCRLSSEIFQPKFPDVFNKFIHIARDLSPTALHKLYEDSSTICPTGKKHMIDALPYIRSRASTNVMTEIILNKEIPADIISEWLTVMAFFPRPDSETIDAVKELILQPDVDTQTMLTVSTMVQAFCQNSYECQTHNSVMVIVGALEKIVNSSCLSLDVGHKAFSALKSIGNAGVVTPTLTKSLQMCILNAELPVRYRVTTVQAHRRLACEHNEEFLTNVFRNNSMDQEIRIAAYLNIMRCPSYNILKIVKDTLDVEEYNQVGSFVWSHLQNQQKSAMPSRVDIQAILQDERFNNKFNKDFRKFSRNYENSFYLNTYGFGGFVETNVIFSEKSFIPHSISTNFTIKLFGEAINVFEISIYLESLEPYAEKWFREGNEIIKEKVMSALKYMRVERSTPGQLIELLNAIPYRKEILQEIKASLSFRMFGNELKYFVIEGDKDFQNALQSLNPMKIIREFLGGQELKFERALMLMDTSYSTPMAVGIPLKMNLVSTASINLNAMGHVNASRFLDATELEVDGKLKPSIGINFEGAMIVDAYLVETGVKFTGKVFTSTALEGSLVIKSYNLVSISFNLPMKKSDIFHAETQLIIITGDGEIPIEGIIAGRVDKRLCTWDIIDETIGLKVCANYLIPDPALLLKAPLSLFNGPMKFGISLEKSDPTARKYIIEYKLDTINNKTIVTFKFETPGSTTNRGMKAVIDLDTQSQNLTLAYQSTLSQVQAQGFYRNTDSEKSINFALDINGKKHIDIQIGVEIMKEKYGGTYLPRFLFAINDKRIAELSGSYRWVAKKGVSQCHIELDFKTNRFATTISGYVRKNDVSVATNIKMKYKLENGPEETLRVELKIGDRSSKFLVHVSGHLQIESTAYPQINLIMSLRFLRAQDHIECKVDLQNNPYISDDSQKLYMQWAFQHFKTHSGNKMNTSLIMNKPSSDIDIKIGLIHLDHSDGSSSTKLLAKYATGKEIEILLDLTLPLANSFYFESKLQISLNSPVSHMSVFTKIHEKKAKEYDIEFAGTWFSTHNLTVKGVYQDRSTLLLTSHSIKLLARSELFRDILFTGRFIMSDDEYKTDMQAEHNNIKYGLTLRHVTKALGLYESFGEIKYNKTSYSVTNKIDLRKRETLLELHLDQYRDIHITLRGMSNKTLLDTGMDVKWDANRDPSQKLTIIVVNNVRGNLNYDGKAIFEYPGRSITSTYLIQQIGKDYVVSVRAEWSPKEAITVFFHGLYNIPEGGFARFDGRISTPFQNWKYIAADYEFKLNDHGINSFGSVSWINNQKIKFELSYDYLFSEELSQLSFTSILNSTIPEISSMCAIVKHKQIEHEYETEIIAQSSPSNVITFSSSGKIVYSLAVDKYLFSMGMTTPFSSMNRGMVTADLNVYTDRKFRGNIHVIGNDKKYVTAVEGSAMSPSESKFTFHIATPIEKYRLITGKFGFSASKKHFIAEVKGPSAALGTEIIYIYNNISNFDLKLRVHTSVTVVNSLLLVGKMNFEMVDLRCGWNTLMIGLIGSSHYKSWKDVDYSLQLFTPIEGFPTCSAIAKLIYKDRLDFEASVNLAGKKIGLMVQAKTHPEDDFALPLIPNVQEVESTANDSTPAVRHLVFEEPEYGTVYWRGVLQLHSLFYPTVHMYTQINEDNTEYIVASFLNFPFGQLKIRDDLEFIDLLHIKNKLNLTTTCDCLQELSGEFFLDGLLGREVQSSVKLDKVSYYETMHGDMNTYYSFVPIDEDGLHKFHFNLRTPFSLLPYCRLNLSLLEERHAYETNISLAINNSTMDIDGTLEIDDYYLETDIGINMNFSYLSLPIPPMCRLTLSKDFTDFEKKIELKIAVPDAKGNSLVTYGIGGFWHYSGPNYMKYQGKIITPYPSIGVMNGCVEFRSDPDLEEYFLMTFLKYSAASEIRMSSELVRDRLIFQVDSSLESFQKILVNSTLKSTGEVKTLEAVLSADKEHRMLGWATVAPNKPLMVEIKLFKTSSTTEFLTVILNLSKKEEGYDVSALIQHYDKKVDVNGDYIILKNLGKKLDILVTSNYPGYESLKLDAYVLTQDSSTMVSKLIAGIVSDRLTTNIEAELNVALEDYGGVLHAQLINSFIRGNTEIVWLTKKLEQVSLDIKGGYSYSDVTNQLTSHAHLWNLDGEFHEVSIGSDVSFNNGQWWLNSNASLLFPEWNDFIFASYVLLPHNKDEMHTTHVMLKCAHDYSVMSHVLKYFSHPDKFSFNSFSDIKLLQQHSEGTLSLETGKHRFYDAFVAFPTNKEGVLDFYTVNNLLKSTNMNEDLDFTLVYSKPSSNHHVKVDICYPETVNIVAAVVDFNALNNMHASMNCSTPFKTFPHVQVLLHVITNKTLYQRFGEVKWTNNSALFNYTHASKLGNDIQRTDGNILVEFPLTTRHRGNLNYEYESSDSFAIGQSSLVYNSDVIMSGNYTRATESTDVRKHETINIKVNNSFMPAGIMYLNTLDKENAYQSIPYVSLKRLEIFDLKKNTTFNVTGEMFISKRLNDKLVTLKALHDQRKIVIDTHYEGENKFSSKINFTMKPSIWAGCGLQMTDRAGIYGQQMEFNISYPRRLFILQGEYDWFDDGLDFEATLFPNQFKKANPLGCQLTWRKSTPHLHSGSIIISHPSFKKNVTLKGNYISNHSFPFDADMELEYSTESNKKLSINSFLEKKAHIPMRHYELRGSGSHPSSRLKLSALGILKLNQIRFELHKNVSYKRSFVPTQFWSSDMKIDRALNLIEMERKSLRDMGYLRARYGRYGHGYTANATVAYGKELNVSGDFFINFKDGVTNLLVNFTPDASEQLHMKGKCLDFRHAEFNVWRTYDRLSVSDLVFFVHLNHSRMVSSELAWRPDIRSDLLDLMHDSSNYIWKYAMETADFWTHYIKNQITESVIDIWSDAKPILQDFIDDVRNTSSLKKDIVYFKKLFNESFESNEFYMQDIYGMYLTLAEEMSFKEKMSHVPKIVNELWEIMGETGETIRQSILWVVESVKNIYEKLVYFIRSLLSGETIDQISQYIQMLAGKYDKVIKSLHITFLEYMEELWESASSVASHYWSRSLQAIEPTFIQIAHYIETVVWSSTKKSLEFLFETPSELLQSSVLAKNSNLTKDIDKFYKDITRNDFMTNLKKYSSLFIEVVKDRYFKYVPFGKELNEIASEIVSEIKELYKLPFINFTIETTKSIYSQLVVVYEYLHIGEQLQRVIPVMYKTLDDLSHTALENEIINHKGKTTFIFEPESGLVRLEQKLPFPWHAFNETPNFEEIPEYKTMSYLQQWLTPSNRSFWTYYYHYAPLLDPSSWLPPYKAQAVISGGQHFMTFDKRHYEFKAPCSFLLAKDFVNNSFTLVLKHEYSSHNIVLIVDDHIISVDLLNDAIRLESQRFHSLPVELGDTYIIREEGLAIISSKRGFTLQCNLKYDVCTFSLSGWYFGSTAGLLGTMDNEPYNDFLTSFNTIETNVEKFVKTWQVGSCKDSTDISGKKPFNKDNSEICNGLFQHKTSSFVSCYSAVNPKPFNTMCHRSLPGIDNEICTSAFAYVKACEIENTPLRIPAFCSQCQLTEDITMEEGSFGEIIDDMITQSTDVVFIVEAKECNAYVRDRKMINTFMSYLSKELANMNLTQNRFGLVTFGGDGVYNSPRSIFVNSEFFTGDKAIVYHFENITSGHGNSDIFGALRYASKLQFRPGVSKTFILIPCSNCDPMNMTVEFSVIHHVLIEKAITLHILMNTEFDLEKLRVNKMFYGLDAEKAYTKKDFTKLSGDRGLRRQIKLTKAMLGYCTPLALETNGTIFTATQLRSDTQGTKKKFFTVFTQRIARSAIPDSCQHCECIANSNGIQHTDCFPCDYPTPVNSDFDYKDNTSTSLFNAFDQFGDSDFNF